jgi:glycosyltransferase involved in cell wall biosynthesis
MKVYRVISEDYVLTWHFHQFLISPRDYELTFIGKNLSKFSATYPTVRFIDIPISRKIDIINDFKSFFYLSLIFIRDRPSIVHSTFLKAGLLSQVAAFFTFVPNRAHTFTGQFWYNNPSFLQSLIFKLIDRVITSLSSSCLCDSYSQSNFLYVNGFSKNKQPFSVIPPGSLSGITLPKPSYCSNITSPFLSVDIPNKSHDYLVVGYLARKTFIKGALDFLRAAQLSSQFDLPLKFLFVGPYENTDLKLMSTLLNLSSTSTLCDIEELTYDRYHYYNAMDILMAPSYREGFGTAIIEAASIGVPTLGYDIVGLRSSIIDNKTGKLFPCGEYRMFLPFLIFLHQHRSALQKYSEQASLFALKFDSIAHAHALSAFYRSLVEY